MNSELAVMPKATFEVLKEQAQILLESGFLPKAIDTVPKAVAIAMHGAELGIPIWTALNNINVIQGKPCASPQLMLALINRARELEDMSIDVNAERAVVTMKRKGRTAHVETFSMVDARLMQTTEYVNGQKRQIPLADKYNWKQMPQTMMKWRAVAACARIVYPDAILGLYTPDEMGADVNVDDEGNMTVIEVKRETPPQLIERTIDAATGEIDEQKPAHTQTTPLPPSPYVRPKTDVITHDPSKVTAPTHELPTEPPADNPLEDVGKPAELDKVFPRDGEQAALGLMDKPEEVMRKWDLADVKTHAIILKSYCKVSEHFDNLIKKLYDEKRIGDHTTTEGVIAEIDLYYSDGHHKAQSKERKLA